MRPRSRKSFCFRVTVILESKAIRKQSKVGSIVFERRTLSKMSRSTAARILVIGELNVDIVAAGVRQPPEIGIEVLAKDCELTLGSASAIFAAGVAKLGCVVTFVSQVGKDSFGDFCVAALKDAG